MIGELTIRKINILNGLTDLIVTELHQLDYAMRSPGADPDTSDAAIDERQHNVKELRRIREELEALFTGTTYVKL